MAVGNIDPTLAHILPGKQEVPKQEPFDPAKATYPKGRFGKVTVPLNNTVFYTPTYTLSGSIGPILPIAFSTGVHGIENAKLVDLKEHREINFVNVGFVCEEIPIPQGILDYIQLNKENLKKASNLVAWDRFL